MQMRDAVHHFISDADVLVMSAAVADFRPATPATQKIKKRGAGAYENSDDRGQDFSVHFVQNPDILQELAIQLKESPDHINGTVHAQRPQKRLIRVGFAAETEQLLANAQEKLHRKQLDLLVANDVARPDSGFGTDTNKVSIFHANGAVEDFPVMPKTGVAAAIWDRVVPLLSQAQCSRET